MRRVLKIVVIGLCAVAVGAGLVFAARVAVRWAGSHAPAPAPAPGSQAASPAVVSAALSSAAAALRAGDRAAYDAALPTSGAGARAAVGELFARLHTLPWRRFALLAEPSADGPGWYTVRAAGQVGPEGPADRLAGVRVLRLVARGSGVEVVDDATPPELQRRYLMVFQRPVAIVHPPVVVIAEGRERARALEVAADAADARAGLARLGLEPRHFGLVLVTVYSSGIDARDALDLSAQNSRAPFFAHDVERVAARPWPLMDVAVVGPWLRDAGPWVRQTLTHELTHAYTREWFAGVSHRPALLVEGVAVAAESGLSYAPLRDEVATGNQLWPLAQTLASRDLWPGNTTGQIHLAYLEGGSVILYVRERWGVSRVRPFVRAVSDSDLSQAGLDDAVRGSLGVSWKRFIAGWRSYVMTLP